MAKRVPGPKRLEIAEYYRDNDITLIEAARLFNVSQGLVQRVIKEYQIVVDTQRNRRGKGCWNKGQTKHTDARVASYAKTKSKDYILDGYRMVWSDELRKSVREHHYVWFRETNYWPNTKLGEQVHHIDGDKLNNNFDNLVLTTVSEHSAIHKRYEQLVCLLIKKGYVSYNKQTNHLEAEFLWRMLNENEE